LAKELTKVDDVEYFATSIFSNTRKHSSICTGRYANNRGEMGMIMLDKLDTDVLFLPELEMTIDGCCDDKVCPV
jgi:hypothetical protein